jgi:hypothetical protein
MKLLFPLLGVALALSACSQRGDVETAIKDLLRDPDSAKFRAVVVNKPGNRACAVFNARNAFGGYGEWTVFELRKRDTGWQVSNKDFPAAQCTEAYFALEDQIEEGLRDPRLLHDRR